jgi:lipopolysaccharide export LptBFGC system permease protein LptF
VVILYFTNVISGTLGIILLALSAIFVVTSILSICPLYTPLGLSTRKKE